MIKRLRIRFILTTILSVLLVLVIIMGSINLLNFRGVVSEADELLEMIASNDGCLPQALFRDDFRRMHGDGIPPQDDFHKKNGIFQRNDWFSEETPFESRYFSVQLDADGEICEVLIDNIASVSVSDAETCAQEILAGNAERGFLDSFRYLREETDDGTILVFLDCGRSLSNFRSFLLYSLLVSAAALLLVGGIVVLISGRVLRPIAESYEKQKGFITDAGHELRTPVTVIEADASVLEMEIGENEWLTDIRRQTGRLAELTRELTYLSRMEEGGKPKEMIDFPISDVVAETAKSFTSRAMVAGKELQYSAAPMLTYCGDEAQIRKLVSILLDNAVKYSSEGGKIALSLDKKNKNIVLTVSNTVENIDKEMTSHMFERFYRGDKSRTSSESGGFGLGLSIAAAITAAHKGKISAAAQEDGKMLTVTVIL